MGARELVLDMLDPRGLGPGVNMVVAPDYPTLRQAAMPKFFEVLTPESGIIATYNRSDRHLRLIDGNEVFFRSADDPDSLRGPTLKRAWLDEGDVASEEAWQMLQLATIATGGRLIVTTTPKGRWVYKIARECREREQITTTTAEGRRITGMRYGSELYDVFQFPSIVNPAVSAAALEQITAGYSEKLLRQETLGSLEDWGGQVFPDPWALVGDYELCGPQPGRAYVAGWDLARKRDWTVGVVLDASTTPARVVAFQRFQHRPWPLVAQAIKETAEQYPGRVWVDSTGVGDPLMDYLEVPAEGYLFTAKSKTDLLQHLILAMEERAIRFPRSGVEPMLRELADYRWQDRGLTTDCVMALALAAWELQFGTPQRIDDAVWAGPARVAAEADWEEG